MSTTNLHLLIYVIRKHHSLYVNITQRYIRHTTRRHTLHKRRSLYVKISRYINPIPLTRQRHSSYVNITHTSTSLSIHQHHSSCQRYSSYVNVISQHHSSYVNISCYCYTPTPFILQTLLITLLVIRKRDLLVNTHYTFIHQPLS